MTELIVRMRRISLWYMHQELVLRFQTRYNLSAASLTYSSEMRLFLWSTRLMQSIKNPSTDLSSNSIIIWFNLKQFINAIFVYSFYDIKEFLVAYYPLKENGLGEMELGKTVVVCLQKLFISSCLLTVDCIYFRCNVLTYSAICLSHFIIMPQEII